jgi:hypothetical protein
MIVTVRVKLKGKKPLEGKLELKGPFHTGDVVTLITGIAGRILQASARDYIEVEVEPSVYEHFRDVQQWKDAF